MILWHCLPFLCHSAVQLISSSPNLTSTFFAARLGSRHFPASAQTKSGSARTFSGSVFVAPASAYRSNHDCKFAHLKNITTLLYEMQNLFLWLKVYCFPSNVGGSENSWLWCVALMAMNRTGCHVRQLECQTSNITASVQIQTDHLLHKHMLPVFFVIDQTHHPHRSANIQPMSQQATASTHPYWHYKSWPQPQNRAK